MIHEKDDHIQKYLESEEIFRCVMDMRLMEKIEES